MKTLQNLLDATPGLIESQGDTGKPVSGVVFDSRKVQPGNVFVAVKGRQTDGHQYIDMALQKGAAAIVGEWLPAERPGEVCFVRVLDSAESLGWMAARWYDFPSRRLKLVGVTGTNGKTTTATLLHKLYSQLGFKTGLLSTVENKIGNAVLPSAYTTPDAVQLQGLLHEMAEAGCSHAFMEVSSHAIDQRRIAGLDFAGGIFTNITHDHLDYHGTFDAYLQAKKKFFDDLKTNAFALVNIDDRRGMVMVQNTNAVIRRYSLHRLADFKAKVLENTLAGLHLELDGVQVFTRLIGDFNAYNLLAVYGAACMLGESREEILPVLSNLTAAEGRFD